MEIAERKLKRNNKKKGSIMGVFLLLVVLFGLAIFIVVVGYVIPTVTDGLRNSALNDTNATRYALNEADNLMDKLDGILLMIFVGLLIGMLISSFMIDSHPIFIPIFIFLIAFAVIVGAIMGNVYEKFTENEILNATATSQTYSQTILGNYALIILGVGVLCMIIIFAKVGTPGGGRL